MSSPTMSMATSNYIPLSKIYPAFAEVAAVELPASLGACAITPDLWGILGSAQTLSVRQHVKIAPKQCFRCPPCVKQENTYSIYLGTNRENQYEILRKFYIIMWLSLADIAFCTEYRC